MKKFMNKFSGKSFFFIAMIFVFGSSGFSGFSQESSLEASPKSSQKILQETSLEASPENDAIVLPDVSTEIQGGAPKAGKSAVPDFSSVIPERQTEGLVPRLPDAVRPDSSVFQELGFSASENKTVYAEGLAGIGFPGFFTGNFSVCSQSGPSPFRISFGHETSNGYSGNSLSSGFFDKDTLVSVEKTFSFSKGKLVFSGLYNSLNDGLQDRSENISDVTREIMKAGGEFSLSLPEGFSFGADFKGSRYRRFGTIVGKVNGLSASESGEIPSFAKSVDIVDLQPEISFDFKRKNFFAGFKALYSLYLDAADSFSSASISQASSSSSLGSGSGNGNASELTESSESLKASNRGDFSLAAGFENDFLKAFTKAGIVAGTNLNGNSLIFPFEVSADFKIPVDFSLRPLKISVSGGLDSFEPKIDSLEIKNTFSAFSVLPSETSDWFGKLDFSLPVKDSFAFNVQGEFRKTAFSNGTWTADYDDEGKFVSGLYTYSKKDMTQMNTKFNVSCRTDFGIFGGNWESFWLDKAANVPGQFVSLNYSFQSENSFFTLDALLGFSPTDDDKTPLFGFEAAFKVSSAVRLALSGNDIVKLVSGKARTYAGQYIQRSGNIALLAKFVF